MNNDDERQRLIVRQSCLNRATDVVIAYIAQGDETYNDADADTLKTMIFSFAQDFEAWVFRYGLKNDNAKMVAERVEQLEPKKKLRTV